MRVNSLGEGHSAATVEAHGWSGGPQGATPSLRGGSGTPCCRCSEGSPTPAPWVGNRAIFGAEGPSPAMDDSTLTRAEDLLEYDFVDREVLDRALTHSSTASTRHESNERLEFLGDAVLGLVVCEYLHRAYPDLLEGEMTKVKSAVVSRRACAEEAQKLGIDELLVLGKGMASARQLPSSVAAAVWESVIGALYLDGGLAVAEDFILSALRARIDEAVHSGHHHNFKSVLQQMAQHMASTTPVYSVLDEKGPDHAKCFEVAVRIGGQVYPSRWGPNKKRAEQDAALAALIEMGVATCVEDGDVQIDLTAIGQ